MRSCARRTAPSPRRWRRPQSTPPTDLPRPSTDLPRPSTFHGLPPTFQVVQATEHAAQYREQLVSTRRSNGDRAHACLWLPWITPWVANDCL